MPAAIPRTANPVVTVEESFMLSKGKSPVRINQRPSKSIPKFLPAKLFVSAMVHSNSLQFLVLFLCFDQNGHVCVCVFPQRKEILISLARFFRVALKRGRSLQSQ